MSTEKRDIKYINKEFNDYKKQLRELAKNYFPETYNDVTENDVGNMYIEMASYVGDSLGLYQDLQLQETLIQHAKNPGNVYDTSYMLGYKPKMTHVAETELEVTQVIPADNEYRPDFTYTVTVPRNSQIGSDTSQKITFVTKKTVDFSYSSSYDPTQITVHKLENGRPVEFLLKKNVKAFSAEIETVIETVNDAEKFKTIEIQDNDIIGVLDITDDTTNQETNKWTEVPYLGQETVFKQVDIPQEEREDTFSQLELEKVDKRFITRFKPNSQMIIQFGAGVSTLEDKNIVPDPRNVGMSTNQGISKIDVAYDPSNYLYTQTYGLAPSNTTLTIRYLKGGGVSSNVPADTITQLNTQPIVNDQEGYQDTIETTNPEPARGGKGKDTLEEIKQNARRAFSEQKRVVTSADYEVRALSLPPEFGSLAKVKYMKRGGLQEGSISCLYVLAYDNQKNLVKASNTLKKNLAKYMSTYIGVDDTLIIKDPFIINFEVLYNIIIYNGYNSREVLSKCTEVIKDFFNIERQQINNPLSLSKLYSKLDRVEGVQTVQEITIRNKTGGNYSEYSYDIEGAIRNNIVYPSYDPMIFELKNSDLNIKGRTSTL